MEPWVYGPKEEKTEFTVQGHPHPPQTETGLHHGLSGLGG